jgi:hypothetical protein
MLSEFFIDDISSSSVRDVGLVWFGDVSAELICEDAAYTIFLAADPIITCSFNAES